MRNNILLPTSDEVLEGICFQLDIESKDIIPEANQAVKDQYQMLYDEINKLRSQLAMCEALTEEGYKKWKESK